MEFQNRMIALSTQHLTLEESNEFMPHAILNSRELLEQIRKKGVVSKITNFKGEVCIAFECDIVFDKFTSDGIIQTQDYTRTTSFNIIGPFFETEEDQYEKVLPITGFGQTMLFDSSIRCLSDYYHIAMIREIIETGFYSVKKQDLAMLNHHISFDADDYYFEKPRKLPIKIEFL